ncbi:hypothetical protein [Phyllobacterium zundukense]|uniref:Uncharacterized protein n=1 Tax=Phyllobacterium zundukense TaxID=1867719 RepID=A0ACD4CYJ7_9HYPH|nr:hypothetical protein [Phyllobacterium zundukense]UXN58540.1 hypothetical protein N8E88_11015 [Phyllobacterium zundukense]
MRLEILGSGVLAFTPVTGSENGVTLSAAPADILNLATGAPVGLKVNAGACLVFLLLVVPVVLIFLQHPIVDRRLHYT